MEEKYYLDAIDLFKCDVEISQAISGGADPKDQEVISKKVRCNRGTDILLTILIKISS